MTVNKIICAFSILLMTSYQSFAHTASTHEHAEVVPIPSYNSKMAAGGVAAYQAAQALFAELSPIQKEGMIFSLNAKERTQWSNLPTGRSGRSGLSIGEMSERQRALLFDFLSASLGDEGYLRMSEILAAEAYLSSSISRSGRMGWQPENYWLAFFNEPTETEAWGWHFGGHHLAINISIDDGQIESLSPTLLGSEPVVFSLNGIEYSVLTDMYIAGLDLYNSLDGEQQSKATGIVIPREVVTGPGEDNFVPKQEGILASQLTQAQRLELLSVIKKWVDIQPKENASKRMEEISAQLDQTAFAWSGTSDIVSEGYFRIQGPSVIIEHLSFGSRRRVGTSANGHYHTMYRNPTNDYGQ